MYPNNRRNFTDTLKRPTDVRPLDGDVLLDTDEASPKMQQRIAELKRLLGKDRENLRAAVETPRAEANPLGGIAPQPTGEEMNRFLSSYGNAAENPQAFSEARRDLTGAQLADAGYRFHGGSWTPRPGDDLNAKLGAMSQPTDAAGPFAGGMGGDREANLRNSLLAAAQAEAQRNAEMEAFFKQTQQPASVQAERIKNDPRYAPGTTSATGEYHPGGSEFERGKALNAKGAAMQAQNAEAEAAYNAQRAAQGAGKRLGTTPVMAAAVMNSGLLGGEQPAAGAINPGMAVLAPDVVKSQIIAQTAAETAKASNALETAKAGRETQQGQAQLVTQMGQARETQLMQQLQAAQTLEQRAGIERMIEANRSQTLNALLSLGSLPPEVLKAFQPPADMNAALAGSGQIQPVGATPSGGRQPIMQVGATPTPSEREMQRQSRIPTEADFEAIGGQTQRSPLATTAGATPSVQTPAPGETGTQRALDYQATKELVDRHKGAALEAIRGVNLPGIDATYNTAQRAHQIYQQLKQSNPGLPDQAIRYALAEYLGEPRLINGQWDWSQVMSTYDPRFPYYQDQVLVGEVGGF